MSQTMINAACGLKVVDLESPQCLTQERGPFVLKDLPLVEWQSSTTHSLYVLVSNPLEANVSAQDLALALSGGLDFPSPFGLLRAPPPVPPHDCQYCVQQVSGTEWKLVRFFAFLRRTKIADVQAGCGECNAADWLCRIDRLVLVDRDNPAGTESGQAQYI
eukprot:2023319-Amphidinium_carterae.1